jgi:hypothetical protein
MQDLTTTRFPEDQAETQAVRKPAADAGVSNEAREDWTMATLFEVWQAGGDDAAIAFGGLTLEDQAVEVVKRLGRWQPWNLGVQVSREVFRA